MTLQISAWTAETKKTQFEENTRNLEDGLCLAEIFL